MHRFRRKSETKRGQVPVIQQGQDQIVESSFSGLPPVLPRRNEHQPQPLPQSPPPPRLAQASPSPSFLPHIPPSDFRASVILPEFSQQFPVLRSGAQITFEDLKGRLAEQRARRAVHQVTEEEEDMILEALRFRPRGSSSNAQRSQETLSTDGQDNQSLSSNVTTSPSSSRSKRYSNNLFGSGRLRDYTYMRSAASGRSKGSSASTASITPTESSVAAGRVTSVAESTSSSSLRPSTPEGTMSTSSILSSLHVQSLTPPQERGSVAASSSSNLSSVGSGTEEGSSTSSAIPIATAIEYRLAKTMDPAALKRASLALQEVIKELEDETEDEIVLPRSHTPRGIVDDASDARNSYSSFEAGVAVTADKQVISSSEDRTSPLPSRTLPGYIPGMNRPMTPRDFDLDDRSHSTTPRATSPVMNNYTDSLSPSPPTGAGGLGRRESISASTVRQSPRPGTPSLFLQRSPSANGRHTPEDGMRKGDAIEFENPLNSTVLARRRPISPLSNLAASASTGSTGNATSSRPSTPSNIIWQPSLSSSIGTLKGSSHTRSDSWTSDAGSEIQNTVGERGVQAPQRAIRSPPLPDSPSPSNGQATFMSLGAARIATPPPDRAQVIANGMNTGNGGGDVFSSNRSQRSPTPTQNTPRSPSSPAFGFGMDRSGGSRRSSRQNAASPWGFTSTTYAPPMLNIFSNSSRTSIGSCGSSYHSWEGDKDDREWYDQILSGEEPQPVWHDLSVGRTESPLPDDQAEELLRKYFGMTMADFAAIQEKLVAFAGTKGEMVRKRRPSTSQSNYVPPGRVNSPPPQIVHVPASPTVVASMSTEQYSKKASALLDSVVSDIQAKQPPPPPPPLDTTSAAVRKVSPSSPSPGTQKNQTLADVLFGPSDNRSQSDPQSDESERAPDSSAVGTPNESNHSSILNVESVHAATEPPTGSQTTPTTTHPSTPSITHSPYQLSRNSSSARVTPKNEVDLVQEVQARVAYATASLKGTRDGLTHAGSISRKRIDTSQIGTPQLVSHSNPANLEAMQTIPSRSPSLSTNHNSSPSKIGSRFKKLRGTLRAKNPSPLTEELASSASGTDVKSPTSSQAANYDPARFRAPGSPALASAVEPGRSKVAVPSPPASAGPGLKGFISRFRGKPRVSEPPPAADKRVSPQPLGRAPPLLPLSPRQQDPLSARTPTNDTGLTSPAPKPDNVRQSTTPPTPVVEQSPTPTHDSSPSFGSRQSVMIQQLFDAANNLGLDQNALNDLLVRSGSITTRATKLSKANSQVARSNSRSGQRSETPTILEQSNSGDTSQLTIQPPSPATSRPTQSTPEPGSTRPLVFRPPPDNGRKARGNRGDRAASTIVRRTIIIPDNAKAPTTDPQNAPQRANSVKRNRRGSLNSGSLKDRAPTPPPPRSPVGQRFSDDGSPPVPSLPQSLGPDVYLTAPRANMEKSTSTYDSSIYEMYTGAGESRVQSAAGMETSGDNTQSLAESIPALECVEYANGDTIWSIVSGLRSDEDEESIYTGRASFASEYSAGTQGGQDWDNMQITVKEHARSNSRGSYSSFALKNKKQSAQGKSRPETKVYYSSTAQIGRLIENLSQGMDSGSFNFTPNSPRPGHSASSSLSTNDMTIEERLEHLLGSINRSP